MSVDGAALELPLLFNMTESLKSPHESPLILFCVAVGSTVSTLPADRTISVEDSLSTLLLSCDASPYQHGDSITKYKLEWWTTAGTNEIQTVTTNASVNDLARVFTASFIAEDY